MGFQTPTFSPIVPLSQTPLLLSPGLGVGGSTRGSVTQSASQKSRPSYNKGPKISVSQSVRLNDITVINWCLLAHWLSYLSSINKTKTTSMTTSLFLFFFSFFFFFFQKKKKKKKKK